MLVACSSRAITVLRSLKKAPVIQRSKPSSVCTNLPPGASFLGSGVSLAYSGMSAVTLYASEASPGSTIAVAPQSGLVVNIYGDMNLNNTLTVSGVGLVDDNNGDGSGDFTLGGTLVVNYFGIRNPLP